MNVVAVPKPQYGNFYKGDSYIVLSLAVSGKRRGASVQIKDAKGSLDAHIHFWLGKETSQDEAGVAAFKSVELDDMLGGFPVQHREVQGNETKLFLSYFKKGLHYKDGGVASGFNHVDHTFKQRLLQVKGKHCVRVQEVDMSWSSFNSGDVFILDLGKMLFVWNGKESSRTERFKGLEQARMFRDERSKVNIVCVNEGEESKMTADEQELWNAHLPLSECKVKSASEGGADAAVEKTLATTIKLYRCKEDEGTLRMTEDKSGPLLKSDLDSTDSFIIDNGENGIWAWIGKNATKQEKAAAMRNAMGFLKKKGLPDSTSVTRVVEGGEPSDFKCLFKSWPMPQATGKAWQNSRIAKTVQTKFDASTLHSNRALAAETQMCDDGSGTCKVWRVENFDLVPLDKKYIGQFFAGDCYVILYTYQCNGRDNCIVYYWQGNKSSHDEKGTSALKAVEIDDSLGGAAVQVRVVQGKEPQHFMAMFDGKMIIFSGGKAGWDQRKSAELKQNGVDPGDGPGDEYMLQVRGLSILNTKAIQVPMSALSLNSNDTFVVFTRSSTYIWNGKGSIGDEREAAKLVATRSNKTPIMVIEGQEKQAFWDAIGGKQDYASDKRLQEVESVHPPRLFQCSNASGNFKVEEIFEFTQEDCVTDDVMLLDAWDNVYIWVGENARKDEKDLAEQTAREYIESDPAGRDPDTPIFRIKQGCEPPTFTGFFGPWDPNKWANAQSYEQLSQQLKDGNDAVVLVKEKMNGGGEANFESASKYPLAQLQVPADELPEGVDNKMREMYLSADDFKNTFGMSYPAFLSKPMWKQQEMKKKNRLF